MIKDENFVSIQGWMLNQLHLKGTELLVYAIIFGFSQTDGQQFEGSIGYLTEWTNSTRKTVFTALSSLLQKGYIEKIGKDRSANISYRAIGVKKLHSASEETTQGECKNYTQRVKKLHSTSEEITHNNIEDNIADNIEENIEDIEPRHRYGEYKNVLLTDKQMEKLKAEFPNDWADRIERVSVYQKSTGKPYKDYLATIRNWARWDREKEERRQAEKRKLIPEDQRDHRYDALFE